MTGYLTESAVPTSPAPDGIIPFRPLSISDIFNGAVGCVRLNPKATLGLTAIVIIVLQAVVMLFEIVPLVTTDSIWILRNGFPSSSKLISIASTNIAGGVAIAVATTLLLGMLTIVVERAIFGKKITIGEAWQQIRKRILALSRLALLIFVMAILFALATWFTLSIVVAATGAFEKFSVGILIVVLLIAAVYVCALLAFAPIAVVLERKSVSSAIFRSVSLVHKHFWRAMGVLALGSLVTGVLGMALAVPFGLADGMILAIGQSTGTTVLAAAVSAVGTAVGQIITVPFTAGVVVLLYTDIRIRFEGFDSALETYAKGSVMTDPTVNLWVP
jgi:hypothetical protein